MQTTKTQTATLTAVQVPDLRGGSHEELKAEGYELTADDGWTQMYEHGIDGDWVLLETDTRRVIDFGSL